MNQTKPIDRWLTLALFGAIALRFILFLYQFPVGNDNHEEVIHFILAHHKLPHSGDLWEAFQPPLYYLIAAVPLAFTDLKTTQFLSCIFSCANIALICAVVRRTRVIQSDAARLHAFLLAAVMPLLIFEGNLVSNESLTYLLGTATAALLLKMIEDKSLKTGFLLAFMLGIGLLTKQTFLVFAPTAFLFFIDARLRQNDFRGRVTAMAMVFTAIVVIVGGYKFAENIHYFGRMLVTNVDLQPNTLDNQIIHASKWKAFFDFNIVKLILHPGWNEYTHYSPPLLFYTMFWTLGVPHIAQNLLIALALVPTGLVAAAGGRAIKRFFVDEEFSRQELALTMLIGANVVMVVMFGLRHYLTSAFQGRYLLPSMLAIVLMMAVGIDLLASKKRTMAAVHIIMVGLYVCMLVVLRLTV